LAAAPKWLEFRTVAMPMPYARAFAIAVRIASVAT